MSLSNIAKYHLWVGDQTREILRDLTEEEFSRDLGEPIGAVRDKVMHILQAFETCFALLTNDWDSLEKTTKRLETMNYEEVLQHWEQKDKELQTDCNVKSRKQCQFSVPMAAHLS